MIKLLLTIFLIYFSTSFISANCIIRGKIDPLINSDQRFVRLIYFKDYISNEIKTLDFDILNDQDEFELDVDISEIQYCFIEYEFKIFGIYIEPGKTYSIELKLSQSGINTTDSNPFIELYILSPAKGLNQQISNFNMIIEDFMIDNMKNSYGKIDKTAVIVFKEEYLSDSSANYFSEYKRYKIASLELLSRITSKKLLADNYFAENKILYNNIEYMDFFMSFFSEFIVTNRSMFSQSKVVAAINQSSDYNDIDNILSKASYLHEKELRELVLLLNLNEMFYLPSFNQNKILEFITQISEESSYTKNKEIAYNIINRLENPLIGKEAPDISLRNSKGELINLHKFHGKPIYLSFIRPENYSDQSELESLKNIFPDFSDKVNFICIAINGTQKEVEEFIHSNDYPFTFLILGDNIDILEKFNIYKAPLFIILDKDFIINSAPSLSPSEELARYLNSKLKE